MRWSWKSIAAGALTIAIGVAAAGWGVKWLWSSATDRRPKLVDIPPLVPITLSSMIIAPADIAITAIRDAIESTAPRDFTGRPDIPPIPFVSNAEIAWSVSRGAFAVSGGPGGLSVSAPVSGSLRATGQMMSSSGRPARLARRTSRTAWRFPWRSWRLRSAQWLSRLSWSARRICWSARQLES